MAVNGGERVEVSTHGTFRSVPGAFAGARRGLQNAVKLEFRTLLETDRMRHLRPRTVFLPQWLMVDVGAVDLRAVSLRQIVHDCDLLKRVALERPDDLRRLIGVFQPRVRQTKKSLAAAARLAESLCLTEYESRKSGGGIIVVLIAVAAAVLASGCAHTSKYVKPDPKPGQGGGKGKGAGK